MDILGIVRGRQWDLFSALVIAGVSVGLWLLYNRNKRKLVLVGTVSELYMYPLKSGAGVLLDEALCTTQGFQLKGTHISDRFLVVTTADYNFITQRQSPSLALIKPSIKGNEVRLHAPNMEELVIRLHLNEPTCTVKMWGQSKSAVDCGEEAARWLSTHLQRPAVRLCAAASSGPEKRFLRNIDWKQYARFYQQPQVKPDDQIAFSDMSPFMILSENSLSDLNRRLNEPVSVRNFRPSIVVRGCPPFAEDSWRRMEIGNAKFSFFMLCNRCMLTQVDPDAGSRRPDQEPLKTLRTYRLLESEFGRSPIFGTHWVLDRPGAVHVGDKVYVSKVL